MKQLKNGYSVLTNQVTMDELLYVMPSGTSLPLTNAINHAMMLRTRNDPNHGYNSQQYWLQKFVKKGRVYYK